MTADALNAWLYGNADPKTRGEPPTPVLGSLMGIKAKTPNRSRRSPAETYAALQAQCTD